MKDNDVRMAGIPRSTDAAVDLDKEYMTTACVGMNKIEERVVSCS